MTEANEESENEGQQDGDGFDFRKRPITKRELPNFGGHGPVGSVEWRDFRARQWPFTRVTATCLRQIVDKLDEMDIDDDHVVEVSLPDVQRKRLPAKSDRFVAVTPFFTNDVILSAPFVVPDPDEMDEQGSWEMTDDE